MTFFRKILVTAAICLAAVGLNSCWHPTVATKNQPELPGYSHLLTIPMQDEAGAVNDWATTLYVPIHIDTTRHGDAAFNIGKPVCLPHLSSRLRFIPRLVWGEIKNGQFTGVMFLAVTNDGDNPFFDHAILMLEGRIPNERESNPVPVDYTIEVNLNTSIHPNNAWFSPPWYQRNIRLNLLPKSGLNQI